MKRGIKGVVALSLALCLVPVSASAAAPANDDFADRMPLSAPLPIEKAGSNEGAASEENEPFTGFESGRSVWYEWVAPSSDWFTIGACDSNFAAAVGIFTGTEVGNLTRVAGGVGSEGPDCANQRQYTFHAAAATQYMIRVAGQSVPTPEGPPPPVEGTFTLQIEETPPPPDDDFADAEVIDGKTGEEPGGARYYVADLQGYNWGATDEPGEFKFGNGPVSSVWYRWSAPETATYRLNGPCCGSGLHWGLFGGGSFGEENEMVAASESAEVSLVGGTEYWIDVYGVLESGMTEPRMGSFGFLITASLPPLPPTPGSTPAPAASGPVPDATPPETRIDRSNLRIAPRTATFWFSASEATQGFQCQLDKGEYKPCGSPRTYGHLTTGKHTFRVKAVDVAGNVDGSPAVAHFKVPRPYKGRR